MLFIFVAILACALYFYSDVMYLFMAKRFMKEWKSRALESYQKYPSLQKEIKFCFYILTKTSRSFSSVIM